MRQIKFRAWTKRWGMVYPDDPEKTINVHSQTVWHDSIDEEFVTLEQFTGLLDATGKEIYEGDIVTDKPKSNKKPYYIVIYNNSAASFSLLHAKSKKDVELYDGELARVDSDIYRVIGNIHQNPELLK
jgi:uncharacterized phage protein (TIGR01671 family)